MQFRDTEYYELHGSPAMQLSNDGARITRQYLVRWDDVYRAYIDFVGYSYVANDGPAGANVIHRVVPHSCHLPGQPVGNPYYYAVAVPQVRHASACDHDHVREMAHYTWAVMTVVYTPLTYDVLPDNDASLVLSGGPLGARPHEGTLARYVTVLGAPMSRTVTLPRGLMRWVPVPPESSVPVFESAGRAENGETVTMIHHLRPDLPRARILACMNRVNSVAIGGFGAQTLLCNAPDYQPVTLPDGARAYDVHFRFTWLPKVDKDGNARGHNWFLRKLSGDYDYRQMTIDGTAGGTPPYRTADFRDLFRPD